MTKENRLNRNRRRRVIESMEPRIPLAGDVGHNFLMPGDVNNDHCVKAGDALAIINLLARHGESRQDDARAEAVDASVASMFYDVNDDGRASAADALRVINEVAHVTSSAEVAQWFEAESGVRARIELETSSSGRVEFSVRLTGAPTNQSYDVIVADEVLGQITTNDQGRGKLELKYGGSHPAVPEVLATATSSTPVAIGNLVSGTLGGLGEDGSSDGGEDDGSQHDSDDDDQAISDSSSDQDADDATDGSTDGGADAMPPAAPSSSSLTGSSRHRSGDDANDSSLSDGGVDGESDGGTDSSGDDSSDDDSGASTDGGSDASTDGQSDGSGDDLDGGGGI